MAATDAKYRDLILGLNIASTPISFIPPKIGASNLDSIFYS